MANPSPTARGTPAGIPLGDGFATLITFERDLTVELWEKTVQPPGMDGGDAVETTTMLNTLWRTMRPRKLITLTEASLTVAYDPVIYTAILSLLNEEDTITVTFPDGSTVAFFGYLRTFEPSDNQEGEQPEADITIQPTNWDFNNSVEAGPFVTEVAGT